MYQICTRTTVNNGHLRIMADSRKVSVSREDSGLSGVPELATIILITRRSQVQILPPPPSGRPGHIEFPGLRRSGFETATGDVQRLLSSRLVDQEFSEERAVDVYRCQS